MSDALIKTEAISKIYSAAEMNTHALRGIDLEIFKGEYVSISGPSGCGKSTLLSILGLLDFPTSGKYWFDGEEMSNLSLPAAADIRNTKMGFVFQQFNLIDDLNVIQNVALPLTYGRKNVKKAVLEEMARKCLALVNMEDKEKYLPKQLSGGQQQLISIARAMVTDPDILFVDEATGNLDSNTSQHIMQMFHQLHQQGKTLCIVTHDPNFAEMAERQLHLLDGRLLGQSG